MIKKKYNQFHKININSTIYKTFLLNERLITITYEGIIFIHKIKKNIVEKDKQPLIIELKYEGILKCANIFENGLCVICDTAGQIILYSIPQRRYIDQFNHGKDLILDVIFFKRKDRAVLFLLVLKIV
eukprot:TRINITY_DN6397_c0_g1_i1.p2 TRINITY_DN6397_c0_g1~~TRINITY_DN6397_c0_g1_i1.p2  ORF type:complete len:128 (+),score=11.14 TRINITY_DN6397_c0_g1_i1:106-489(+)